MFPFPFLILLIRMLSLCPLMSLAKGLSILLIFSKNQLLVLLILCIVLFVSIWLISALSLIISCCLLLLGEFSSFVPELSGVLSSCQCMFSPVSFWRHSKTAFIVSHKFGYVLASFSLNSKKSLISFFISSLTELSLSRLLFSFHVYVGFLLFMLLLKMSLSLW